MAQQTKTITSESLESAYRALTPSQDGFTEDLMASNTIIPVLDLTADAQGETTPQNLQTALAFGSQTAFSAQGGSDVVANTAGFYRIFGTATCRGVTNTPKCSFTMTDGVTVKTVWAMTGLSAGSDTSDSELFDFVVFLASGESITAVSSQTSGIIQGSSRQIADVNGNLVNPSGFTPQ